MEDWADTAGSAELLGKLGKIKESAVGGSGRPRTDSGASDDTVVSNASGADNSGAVSETAYHSSDPQSDALEKVTTQVTNVPARFDQKHCSDSYCLKSHLELKRVRLANVETAVGTKIDLRSLRIDLQLTEIEIAIKELFQTAPETDSDSESENLKFQDKVVSAMKTVERIRGEGCKHSNSSNGTTNLNSPNHTALNLRLDLDLADLNENSEYGLVKLLSYDVLVGSDDLECLMTQLGSLREAVEKIRRTQKVEAKDLRRRGGSKKERDNDEDESGTKGSGDEIESDKDFSEDLNIQAMDLDSNQEVFANVPTNGQRAFHATKHVAAIASKLAARINGLNLYLNPLKPGGGLTDGYSITTFMLVENSVLQCQGGSLSHGVGISGGEKTGSVTVGGSGGPGV